MRRSRTGVVRPNIWDSREVRLENLLRDLLRQYEAMHPQDFEGPDTLRNLNIRTTVLRARHEIDKPVGCDLDNRVRHPIVRWWRERRSRE